MTEHERLWVADYSGQLVCERLECTGPALFTAIAEARGAVVLVDGTRWSLMNAHDLRELAPLLVSGHGDLGCAGGHVRYDLGRQQLLATEVAE